MSSQRREWLLVLDDANADLVLPKLRHEVTVTHRFAPRVVVAVSENRDPTSALSLIPGVRRVYADDVLTEELESDEAFTTLGREEALAVRAWLSRQQPEKRRPGEGLDWDAEGFEPP